MSQVLSDFNFIIPQEHLQNLLTELDEFIGSKRLKSRIASLKELLDVLWKRNVLQTEEGKRVATIFTKYPNVEDYFVEYLSRPSKTCNEPTSKSSNSYSSTFQTHKAEIYKLIINKVAANYLAFGRGLGLSSDKLSCIEKNLRMNAEGCETIMYEIMIEAEKEHKHNTLDMIEKALKEIHRNDVVRSVENILKDKS